MKRNWVHKAAAVVLTMGLLAGCGGTPNNGGGAGAGGNGGGTNAPAFRAAMVTDLGGINDESFNAAAWTGLQNAQRDFGFEVAYVESNRQEDYEANYADLMDQGYDMIWGIGFLMGDATNRTAEAHPNQKFGLIDEVVERPNVASVLFREEEGSFLMGVIAAKASTSKVVGFVGGMDIPVIHRFEAGFKAGVKATDPTVEVKTVYAQAFTDPGKGNEVALALIGQGADVLFHASGLTGNGVIQAARERNVFAIGVDMDQNHLAPEHVISSMIKRVDQAIYQISKQTADGDFPGGQVLRLGLAEDGVGYSTTTLWDKMPGDTKALVDKWADAIKAGTVTVPGDMEAFATWQVPNL